MACSNKMLNPDLLIYTSRVSGDNDIPDFPLFTQIYKQSESTISDSRFGPVVRIIEFEYDLRDSFVVIARITTGFNEGNISGKFSIIVDDYELEYLINDIESRDYVERIEFNNKISNTTWSRMPFSYGLPRSKPKETKEHLSRSQIFNAIKIIIHQEDRLLIANSDIIRFSIEVKNGEIVIFPSKKQRDILRKMLR